MSDEELELKFGNKIRQALNHGAENIDAKTAARLFEARQAALGRHRVAGFALAGSGRLGAHALFAYGRTLVAAFALVLGVVSSYYWNHFEQAAENEEVDSALLSDDLPPAAYLDKGFQAWLDGSPQSSQ
jgi:hypothetical protein